MKVVIAIIIAMLSAANANAQVSKFQLCFEATMAAQYAYDLKQEKKKLKYVKMDSAIETVIIKEAMDYGYKAKSKNEAIEGSYFECVNSKFWF